MTKDNNGPRIFESVDDLQNVKNIVVAVDKTSSTFGRYSNVFTYKSISDITDNESYIYHYDISRTDHFEALESVGFSELSLKVKDDVNKNKAVIILTNVFEAYSGRLTGIGSRDFEIINNWINDAKLNPKNVWYITGNLIAHELYQNVYPFNIVSLTIQEEWNDTFGFSKIDLEYEPFEKEYLYVCLNRQPRSHRVFLLANLIKHNLFDKGKISFNLMNGGISHLTNSINTYDSSMIEYANVLEKIGNKYLDLDNTDNLANNINTNLMTGTFVSLITETLCDEKTLQFSEKIWKPIMCGHPFMIVSSNNTLKTLKNLGFKTYLEWFDESYDHSDMKEKIKIICNNLSKYSEYSIEQLKELRQQMKTVAKYNQDVLKEHVQKKFFDKFNNKNYEKPLIDWFYSINKTLT